MTTHQDDGGPGLDAALDEAAAAQVAANAAAGRRTVALARTVAASESSMLDLGAPRTLATTAERRSQVARRALVAEVSCALGVGEHAARAMLADAETLADRAPGTLDALCDGRISYQHARKLADAVADLPVSAAADVEQAVLDRAASMTPARFGSLVRATRERLHPVPAEVRREAAELRADVWLDDGKDGMSWLTAHLPSTAAHAAYDRLSRTAASAKSSGDPRRVGQLRAATLAALVLDDAAPGRESGDAPADPLSTVARAVRPTVHVTVPVLTLAGHSEHPATIGGSTPVDPETARRLAARAPTLRRVLTDPVDGALLTVDRRSYVVPADLRAFLTERDVTCRFPGCRVPAPRCDVDHTIDWADGGTTDAANLAHLCRAHHTLKHESRWSVEQLDAGVLAWTSPRGRTYLTRPGSAEHTAAQLDTWAVEASAAAIPAAPPPDVGPQLADVPRPRDPVDPLGDPPF
ncbi:HNH endonuclease signature motif containing protein [Isoptericola aurantiacus]|uniref:HNH endonuclease signature motif containing protein n=1 Tax=Isoptericola aurantiacus TaxID=3377839 RepID=UPI003839EE34